MRRCIGSAQAIARAMAGKFKDAMSPIIVDVTQNFLPYILHPGADLRRTHDSPISDDAEDDDDSSSGGSVVSLETDIDHHPTLDTDKPLTADLAQLPHARVDCPAYVASSRDPSQCGSSEDAWIVVADRLPSHEADSGPNGGVGTSAALGRELGELRRVSEKRNYVAVLEGPQESIQASPSHEDGGQPHDNVCKQNGTAEFVEERTGDGQPLVWQNAWWLTFTDSAMERAVRCRSGPDLFRGEAPANICAL